MKSSCKICFWDIDARLILTILVVLDQEDYVAWYHDVKGRFSVKSGLDQEDYVAWHHDVKGRFSVKST
jgi:hypothetical protein